MTSSHRDSYANKGRRCSLAGLSLAVLLQACTGNVFVDAEAVGHCAGTCRANDGDPSLGADDATTRELPCEEQVCAHSSGLLEPAGLGATYARRLTRWELQNALAELVDVDATELVKQLPDDTINATVDDEGRTTPFDNDFTRQKPSAVLARNMIAIAEDLSARVVDRARQEPGYAHGLLGCAPSGPSDAACMQGFVQRFARRALRRRVGEAETMEIADLALALAQEEGDFLVGMRTVLWLVLADLEFLYRVERGSPVEGSERVFALGGYEIATRLSFLLWGSIPDEELLDAAEAGELESVAGVGVQFDRMLEDPRAAKQLAHFHELWFGYTEGIPVSPELSAAMHAESEALFERVLIRESRNWFDLIGADETFVTPELATHYGMPAPAEPSWVSYPAGDRRGFFGHGTFLSFGALAGDTSPTRRGILIQENLFCYHIPEPTPEQLEQLGAEDVNIDAPPPGDGCKSDRYAMHAQGGCASCHQLTDPVGFGLERFDTGGAYRTHEEDKPECEIDGQGLLREQAFSGPRGLGEVVSSQRDAVAMCMSQQALQYILGRAHLPEAGWDDARLQDELGQALAATDYDLVQMLRLLATSPAFVHRVEPTDQEGNL